MADLPSLFQVLLFISRSRWFQHVPVSSRCFWLLRARSSIQYLRRLAYFYVTSTRNFERFQYCSSETNFLKKENPFQNLECRFLGQSTKILNPTFPYKFSLSESSVKTNRMGSTKWTYYHDNSFVSNN